MNDNKGDRDSNETKKNEGKLRDNYNHNTTKYSEK